MQERVVREIRTLRAMWRALETGSRQVLNGHEGGNPGHKPRMSLRATAPVLDPTNRRLRKLQHSPTGYCLPHSSEVEADAQHWPGDSQVIEQHLLISKIVV